MRRMLMVAGLMGLGVTAGPEGHVFGIFGPDRSWGAVQANGPTPAQPAVPSPVAPPVAPPVSPAVAPPFVPGAQQAPAVPTPAPGDPIKTAEDLLGRLETADKDLRSLDADMQYDRVFGLAGDQQIRRGKVYYTDSKEKTPEGSPLPGSRKFAIRFDTLQLGARPAEKQEKVMVFDGEWLIEKIAELKEVHKHHIVAPGQAFDPLKIGEGPFPLPIGQKREDILKRFDAVLLPPEQDLTPNAEGGLPALLKHVANSYQLKLTPKAGQTSDFKEVRLWYRPDVNGVLLPRMARTLNEQDDVSLVALANVRLNVPPDPRVMDTSTPAGWVESVDELKAENRR